MGAFYKSPWAMMYTTVDYERKDITVVEVDMDMDGVADGDGDPEVTEEIYPGGFIPLNDIVQIQLKNVLRMNQLN